MELASCHPSGAYSFKVVPRLKRLSTPDLRKVLLILKYKTEIRRLPQRPIVRDVKMVYEYSICIE